MQEAREKPDGLITKNLRYFAFSRVFFRSEIESKTPATSETGLFVALAKGWKLLAQVTWRSIQDMSIQRCGKCFVKSFRHLVAWFTVSARDTFTFCLMGIVVSEIIGFSSKGFSCLVVSVDTCAKNLFVYKIAINFNKIPTLKKGKGLGLLVDQKVLFSSLW